MPSQKGKKGFQRTNNKGDTRNFGSYKCVIGIDQSYTRTGLAVSIDGKLRLVKSISFKGIYTKTEKRITVQDKLRKLIEKCCEYCSTEEIVVICERVRLFTNSKDVRPQVIKAHSALIAYIVDTAAEYGIEVWSVDTRAWKSAVLGTSRPTVEPFEGVDDPNKILAVKKVIDLGFEKQIRLCRNNGAFYKYDDDACDAACISLYGFVEHTNLLREQ